MKIDTIVVSPFQQNCRILSCEETREAIIIDPGDEPEKIARRVDKLGVKLKYLVATHAHIDHVGAAADLQDHFTVPFYLHQGDMGLLEHLPSQMALLMRRTDCRIPRVDGYLSEAEEITFGNCRGRVLHTPGHSPGGISLLFGEDLFCGDLVFAGSIGRTDLIGGSLATLQRSIREKILTLPKSTRIHSGHGPSTTVGDEEESLNHWISIPS